MTNQWRQRMKSELHKEIDPKGIYTGAQAMEVTGIPMTTFYRYVRQEKIPKHIRAIDGRTVFHGHELLAILTATTPVMPKVYFVRPRRGRPKKQANP